MSESGKVVSVKFNPTSESRLQDILREERNRRMSYPSGSQQAHIEKITAKIDAVRKPQEQERPRPQAQAKPALNTKLSPFEQSLNRGKAKAANHKAHNQTSAKTKNKQEEL
jgi:hypothetical protein